MLLNLGSFLKLILGEITDIKTYNNNFFGFCFCWFHLRHTVAANKNVRETEEKHQKSSNHLMEYGAALRFWGVHIFLVANQKST